MGPHQVEAGKKGEIYYKWPVYRASEVEASHFLMALRMKFKFFKQVIEAKREEGCGTCKFSCQDAWS